MIGIVEVKGNLLVSDCDVIMHQANCQKVMGAGIAKQIKEQYPEAYRMDRASEGTPEDRLGKFTYAKSNGKLVVNLYGQLRYGRGGVHTDVNALRNALDSALHVVKPTDKVGIPYKIGCGLAGGDWDEVKKMIEEVAIKHRRLIHIYNINMEENKMKKVAVASNIKAKMEENKMKKENTPLKQVLNKVVGAKNEQGIMIDGSLENLRIIKLNGKEMPTILKGKDMIKGYDLEARSPKKGYDWAFVGWSVVNKPGSIFKPQSTNAAFNLIKSVVNEELMAPTKNYLYNGASSKFETVEIGDNKFHMQEKRNFEMFVSFSTKTPTWLEDLEGKEQSEVQMMLNDFTGQTKEVHQNGYAEMNGAYILKVEEGGKAFQLSEMDYLLHPIAGQRSASWIGIDKNIIKASQALSAMANDAKTYVKWDEKSQKYVINTTGANKRIPVILSSSNTHARVDGLEAKFIEKHETNVLDIDGNKTFISVYEVTLKSPIIEKIKENGKWVIKKAWKIRVGLTPDAYSMPSIKGINLVNANMTQERSKKDVLCLEDLIGFEAAENVNGLIDLWQASYNKVMNWELFEDALEDVLDQWGFPQTDGALLLSKRFADYLAAPVEGVRYAPKTGNFQARAWFGADMPNNKGFAVKNDAICKMYGVDMVMHASVTKTIADELGETVFTLSIMNQAKDNSNESFRPFPSSVAQNLYMDKELLVQLGKEAVDHVVDVFNNEVNEKIKAGAVEELEAMMESADGVSKLNDFSDDDMEAANELFGARKNIAVCPQLIGEQYHRQSIAQELQKSILKLEEGAVFGKGVRPYFMMGDLVAYYNALANGHVIADENGMVTNVMITEQDIELAPNQAVIGYRFAPMVKEAILARCPQLSDGELPVVELTNASTTANKWIAEGELQGVVMLSASGWTAAMMSGADFDGDFCFVIFDGRIITAFKKHQAEFNVRPQLDKFYKFENGKLVVGNGCPFKDKTVVEPVDLSHDVSMALGIKGDFKVVRTGREVKVEFGKDFYENNYELANDIFAYSLKFCVTYNMVRSNIGGLSNNIFMMHELEALYSYIAKMPHNVRKVRFAGVKEALGITKETTDAEIAEKALSAVNKVRQMKETALCAARWEIDAPKYGAYYKEYVQQLDFIFNYESRKNVEERANLAKRTFDKQLVVEKGVFLPLFISSEFAKVKHKKMVRPFKPRWMANQKIEPAFCELKAGFVKNGELSEYRSVVPMDVYCDAMKEELADIWNKFDVGTRFTAAAQCVVDAVGLEMNSKEFKQYGLVATGLAPKVLKAMDVRMKAINKLVEARKMDLAINSKFDVRSEHLRSRRDILIAKLKKVEPVKMLKIGNLYKETINEALEDAMVKCEKQGIEPSMEKLFAVYLVQTNKTSIQKGANEQGFFDKVGAAWTLFSDAAFNVISSKEFNLTYSEMDRKVNGTVAEKKKRVFVGRGLNKQVESTVKQGETTKKEVKKAEKLVSTRKVELNLGKKKASKEVAVTTTKKPSSKPPVSDENVSYDILNGEAPKTPAVNRFGRRK